MPAQAERPNCGDCVNFDRKNVSGEPYGTLRRVNGTVGEAGVCRAPRGLALGVRGPEFPCINKSPKAFTPKATK